MPPKQGFGKKEFRTLYSTYGEKDLYNSGNFDPNTRNLTTGATHAGHHCERCKTPRTKKCFEDLHHAFCAEFVTRNGRRERCGECFALRSDGCSKHRRVHDCNASLYLLADGGDVSLDDFRDHGDHHLHSEQEGSGHDKAAELATIDELAEAHIEEHGYLPATFHGEYFKQRAREMSYAQTEQSAAPQGSLNEGKPVRGKRNKRGSIAAGDEVRRDSGTQLKAILDDSAVKQKGKNQHAAKISFVPTGAKSKKRM